MTSRPVMATLESVVRLLMKTKHRELFLLLCYVAVLIPTAAGQVLCLDCCCADRIQIEPRVCGCCAEPEPPERTCCTEGRWAADRSSTLAFGRTACACAVVPLGPDDPQLTEKDDSQPTATPRSAPALSSCLGPEGCETPFQISRRMRADIGTLSTVILLI